MSKTLKYIGIAILTFLVSGILWPIKAQTTQSFTISPPSIKFELNPGEKVEKSIKITNNSDTDVVFYANIQDFVVTDNKGTPELLPSDAIVDNKYAASTWATVLPDAIFVPAGKTTTSVVYLQVPGDARPGGKYISVAFMPKTAGMEEGTGASVKAVAAVLVYLTVNGETAESGRVVSFTAPSFSEYGPIKLTSEISNTGDIHITPKATIKIHNLFGREVYSTALSSSVNVFPGTTRIYDTTWSKKWLFGRYTANLSGLFGKENNLPLAAVVSFWVIPYKILLIVIAFLGLSLVLASRMNKKELKEIKETPPEEK